jgi:hypothetical protein
MVARYVSSLRLSVTFFASQQRKDYKMKKFLIGFMMFLAMSFSLLAGSVTGSGKTYQEAFKDARARLPAGKYHNSVTSKKVGDTFYVTLHYRDDNK